MKRKQNVYCSIVKPLLDRLIGIIGLISLSWLFLAVTVIILIDDPGPVFFLQKRVGRKKNGKNTYFNILKFRTMKKDAPHDVPTHLMQDPDEWLTRSGRFLRRSSLDELPQLINIAIMHNISIIGPRPALWNQYDLVAEREKYGVNELMPGLTGYAQINGRDELSIEEKAKLDGWYAEHIGFATDVKCFFKSIRSVLKADGYVEGASDGAGRTE